MNRQRHNAGRIAIAALMLLWQAAPLFALPKGGEIISGDVSIEADGDLMTVQQESQRAIVHYDSFNLEVPEKIEFIQPSSSAAILNRVVGGDASEIAGVMVANGHVYLINPNGIVFSSTARIDVGGLIASAMNLRNSDFLSGKLDFYETRGRKVVNKGDIKADHVYLIGNGVNNLGSINAADVILASGTKSVEIDTAAGGVIRLIIEEEPEQAPAPVVIDKDELDRMDRYQDEFEPTPIDPPKDEVVAEEEEPAPEPEPEPEPKPDFSDAGMIINEGLIEAAGPSGGTIVMQGTRVGQLGTVRADATVGDGGTITIYGEEAVALGADSLTTANAGANGEGGDITVLSPGITLFRPGAKIEARGGNESGDGGDVEVSGHDHVEVFGIVDTSSENGKDGTFLIDPANVLIQNVAAIDGDGFWMGTTTFEPNVDDAVIPISVIQDYLLLNSVEITTTERPPGPHAGQDGNITVEDVMTLAGTGNNWLTLRADNDININANITFTDPIAAGNPRLLLRAANDININADITTSGGNVSLGDAGAGPVSVTIDGNIDTGGGRFSSEGVDFTLSSGSTITTDGGAADMASHSGSVDIQDEIDTSGATGGEIEIGGSDITLIADLTTDAGDITIWNPLSIGADISIDTGSGAGNVTFIDTVDADAAIADRELYIAAGSGTVDFQGSAGTTEALEWLTVGAAGRVNLSDVTTGDGGIDVAATTIDLNGTLATDADASGNAGSILFVGAVELSGDSQIDTDHATGRDGDLFIFGTLDADAAANNRAMEFTQGSGILLIRDATGSSEALDSLTVNSAGLVSTDAITTRDGGIDIMSTSGIRLYGDLSTDANLAGNAGNVALSGPVTLYGDTVIDTDHATGSDGIIQLNGSVDADNSMNNRSFELRSGNSDINVANGIGNSETLWRTTISGGNVSLSGEELHADDSITISALGTLSVANAANIEAPIVDFTVDDLDLQGEIEAVTSTTITDVDGSGIGLGVTPIPGGVNITGAELYEIQTPSLDLNTAGNIVVATISQANSANAGAVTLDAGGSITFNTGDSVFGTLTAEADDGIVIEQDITTDTGDLSLDGDDNNVTETRDDIQIAAGTTLTSGGLLSLDATGGGIDAAGDLTLSAAGGVTANDSITVAGELTVDADSDLTLANGDTFTIAAGAAVDAGANAIDLTVGDLDLQGTLSGGSTTITDSDGSGVELGDTLYPRDINISGAELQNITVADLLLRTDGLVTIDGISAAESDNVNDVVIDTSRRVTFLNGASTFDSLSIQADNGIYAEANILTDTGALALDGDADNAVDGNDNIQLASGVMLSSATELSLDATSGGIEVDGLTTLHGRSGVTINDSVTPPAPPSSCNIIIHADIGMPDGNGTFTLASGATLDCGAGRVSVTANDVDIQGSMVGGLAEFDDSDGSGIGLGNISVGGGLNVSGAELQNISVTTVSLNTTRDISVDNVTQANSDGITDLTLDAGREIVFLNNESTFNALTATADDGIAINVDITTDRGNLVMDGDLDNTVNSLDSIQFTADRVLSSAGSITLGATSGDIVASGPLTLNAASGIALNDLLVLSGDGTINADTDAAGGGTLTIVSGGGLDAGANQLNITADDIAISGAINGQTVTITDSDGTGIGIGDTLTAGNLGISGTELANVTAFFLELDTAGSVEIDNVTAAQSDAAGIVTLNANQSISFLNNASTFDSLIVLANNGIRVNTDVSTDEEGFFLDGDADNAAGGSDDIQFADGVTLDSEGMLRLDATSGKMTGSGDVTFNANNTITLNDSLTTAGDQQYNNNLTAANGVTLRAGGDLTVADGFVVRANGSMDMYADHDLTLGGDASSAGHIDLRGDYDEDLDGQLWIKGDVSTDGASPAGTVTLVGDLVVDGSMTVGAPDMSLYGADRDEIDYDIAAPINAGGIIIRMGHDITDATAAEDDLLIADRVELSARTGGIGGAGDADIDMNAGQLKANGRGNVYIEESDNVKASGGIKAGGALDLMVHGTLSGDRATSGRDMIVETRKDLTIKKLEAGGELEVDVRGKIDSEEFRSGDMMTVQAGGSIDSDEFNSGDMMTIHAGDSIDTGILYADGDMDIDGGSLLFDQLTANYVDGDLASHIYVGRMDVDGVVDFNAGGSILDNNSMVSAYDVLFRAGGNIGASAINLDVHQITLVQADGNVHIAQHRKQDTSLGLVSAGGSFKVEVPGGGLVDGNGDGLNLEAYADSYLSLHGTCGRYCDGLDVLIEGGNLSVDAINITDRFTEDFGSWISLTGTINPAGDEEQIVYIGEGEAPGLVLLNRSLQAGHTEITPEIRRTAAFAVETPEIRPKQGVFSSPYFLHNYMYVSEPMAMGLVDYILQSQAEVRADPQFTKTAKREITMWPEGYVW